ncbi:TetR family transcriptional regulator [Streptomyces sp. ME02-6991-2A]|uniref:TetR/AcrR family transcriptional regulator n=1 Tax=Streptomyces sp. ME02-6991-2A TaxID=3028677 RepID=UPI001008460C|nr:TetR family transcriptional regulator [Streptomyces sp. ME02-6991-2A]MDX3373831.1 TetR family transcriptional regulator [Streptomyces sp. ME02-6991-2A]
MARRYDPERRTRIIDAALRVIAADGIAGLSHRTVAAEADVPLGSTTYHFGSLDELLTAALRRSNENFAQALRDSEVCAGDASSGSGLADELTRVLGEWFAGERGAIELEYELYLAALRRPALRPVAAEWTTSAVELLSTRTDPATARALVALLDGVCLQVLLTGSAFDPAYTREMLARVVEGRTVEGRTAEGRA